MINLAAKDVANALPCRQLVDKLRDAFASDVSVPPRAHHEVPVATGNSGILLLMPAWSAQYIGVKIASVFPDNALRGIPVVSGSYLVMDATSGVPLALLDGTELTLQRTAAASALASSYLSASGAAHMLMVGTGNLAPYLIAAHSSVRPISKVTVWGRRPEAALELADSLQHAAYDIETTNNLEAAVKQADIISCATLSPSPLIHGAWLQPGQHLDLVGSFKPDMAEADSAALQRASVYVDTRVGALSEAGEIVQAIASGTFSESDIQGSLRELATDTVSGRSRTDAITLFKSVGTALEDLAAAELVLENTPAPG